MSDHPKLITFWQAKTSCCKKITLTEMLTQKLLITFKMHLSMQCNIISSGILTKHNIPNTLEFIPATIKIITDYCYKPWLARSHLCVYYIIGLVFTNTVIIDYA